MQSSRRKVSINDLPLEPLLKIFKGFTKKELKNCALTCKSFYNAICEIEKYKYPLKITSEVVSKKNYKHHPVNNNF